MLGTSHPNSSATLLLYLGLSPLDRDQARPPDLAAPAELELQGPSHHRAPLGRRDDVLKRCGVAPHKVREKNNEETREEGVRRGEGGFRRGVGQVTHVREAEPAPQHDLAALLPFVVGVGQGLLELPLQPKLLLPREGLLLPELALSLRHRLRDALNDLVKTPMKERERGVRAGLAMVGKVGRAHSLLPIRHFEDLGDLLAASVDEKRASEVHRRPRSLRVA